MLCLLDANVLIDAARDYYPFDMVPEFWDWLLYQGSQGSVKIPQEIYEEVCDGRDQVAIWLREERVKRALMLQEDADPALVARVVAEGYAPDLDEDEVQRIGRDPFIIAHGLIDSANRCVVTTEGSKPNRQRANRHLPDVCRGLGLQTCHTFEFTRRLAFRTRWHAPSEG
jgi:hypothetical protein